jgi:hypothetical protein
MLINIKSKEIKPLQTYNTTIIKAKLKLIEQETSQQEIKEISVNILNNLKYNLNKEKIHI